MLTKDSRLREAAVMKSQAFLQPEKEVKRIFHVSFIVYTFIRGKKNKQKPN